MKRLLTPRDLAQAIGVDERAVLDWADGGQLAIARTGGGHRRIPIAEAVRFIRASRAVVANPPALGLPELVDEEANNLEDALYRCLYEGLGRETRGLLLRRFLAGDPIATLADGPIRGAMRRLGELWKHDARGIFIEHRATDCCIQAVASLRALVDAPDDAPIALGGAPAGDPYQLPSMLAATVLVAEGFRSTSLGPDTPIASLRLAISAHRPSVVWLSSSAPVSPSVLAETTELAAALRDDGVRFVIGGQNEQLAAIPAAAHLSTMTELAAYVRTRPR